MSYSARVVTRRACLHGCLGADSGIHRWLFALEGLLTVIVALLAYLALPVSPVQTKTIFTPRGWYTPKQEIIAINRILRDDPAKGLTALKEPLTLKDIKEGLTDPSMWLIYFIGLIAYIPASPVQGYLGLTLRRIGFSTFDSNMLAIPSAALQVGCACSQLEWRPSRY